MGEINEAHAFGCPARYPDVGGDCSCEQLVRERMEVTQFFVPVTVEGATHYVLTARGLDVLGFPEIAAKQRADARVRLGLPGYDAPAGAGDDVEAYRG